MRERQYSFLFRGNRPSTPFAGNTAHDFARSCRKPVRIVQEFRAVENEAQRWGAIEWNLRIRLVKGEWPGPNGDETDPGEGLLQLVERLAAKGARHLAIAT